MSKGAQIHEGALDVDRDGFSETDVDDFAGPNVGPLVFDLIVEGLEFGDSLLLIDLILASSAKLSLVLLSRFSFASNPTMSLV